MSAVPPSKRPQRNGRIGHAMSGEVMLSGSAFAGCKLNGRSPDWEEKWSRDGRSDGRDLREARRSAGIRLTWAVWYEIRVPGNEALPLAPPDLRPAIRR